MTQTALNVMRTDPVVIVGSGLAGYTVARELRKLDPETPLVIVSRDDGRFYSKPALSNALALKKKPHELASFDAPAMAAQLGARVWTHRHVERIVPGEHAIVVDGQPLRYRALVLATGADPRQAPIQGDGAGDVLSINDLGDYARFREALASCHSVAILGAGLIGCEFANDLIAAGHAVCLIDPAHAPLARLLPQEAGAAFARALHGAGVEVRLGRAVEWVSRCQPGYRLTLDDGTVIDADLVVSAIGLVPRTALARAAGLQIEGGISTDAWCRTSAPDVYALGDCAAIEGRVQPYVLPIMHASRALARTLCGTPTRVEFPVMPVVVKTPAVPAVVVTPAAPDGRWTIDAAGQDAPHTLRAICEDSETKRMTGFALLGAATTEKAAFLKQMAAG
ncbi:Rubredoxin-NAD(+) reductase [Paraburkholderia caffeinitolerans]|uniref:Rubredoxin-NAD(+) reductase n=1 Tax=Paraburkholderia caffeinitolerans TaxID=1723730 RepID=A0A6J5GCN8_9BURK|nr:FAD-dependent oxidoreductase [Paraburkholderia caffeinitolerans]CAB3797839.1 Rubredoxin-NAD(+) reductase [Paraburkholderia caffeinitolerans]